MGEGALGVCLLNWNSAPQGPTSSGENEAGLAVDMQPEEALGSCRPITVDLRMAEVTVSDWSALWVPDLSGVRADPSFCSLVGLIFLDCSGPLGGGFSSI